MPSLLMLRALVCSLRRSLGWLVRAVLTQDLKYVEQLLNFLPVVPSDDVGADEWVHGRAGYLYLLRLVRTYIPSADIPRSVMDAVIQRALRNGPDTPRRWRWGAAGGRMYVGAGHGWIGSVTQMVLTEPSYATQLQPLLDSIVNMQEDSGNWPAFVPDPSSPARDPMCQFGHGAPGVVCSLISLKPFYAPETVFIAKIDEAIKRAQDFIWEKGLLTKESCLQHGAAGNSLALVNQRRAATFLAKSRQEEVDRALKDRCCIDPSADVGGLHKGIAGRIWAFYTFDKGWSARFLSYNEM